METKSEVRLNQAASLPSDRDPNKAYSATNTNPDSGTRYPMKYGPVPVDLAQGAHQFYHPDEHQTQG
jgi:hypothetical protein